MVQQVNVLRPYKKMYDGPTTKQVILCGNGGGRSSTFKWFEDRNITVYPYTSAMGSRFSRRNMVAIGLLNYANSTLITEEEEKKEETD